MRRLAVDGGHAKDVAAGQRSLRLVPDVAVCVVSEKTPLLAPRNWHCVHVANQTLSARETEISGLYVIEMKQFEDERGTVREFYRESDFLAAGLPSLGAWVQVNLTATRQGAVRGLHGEATQKFVGVASGEALRRVSSIRARSRPPTARS